MQIFTSTDYNIVGSDTMTAEITGVVASALRRFSDHVTRREEHFVNENGPKAGQSDIREWSVTGPTPNSITFACAFEDGDAEDLLAEFTTLTQPRRAAARPSCR